MEERIKIPQDNIETLEVRIDGNYSCAVGSIRINGLEVRDKVSSVELKLVANKKPDVTLVCAGQIREEAREAWGISEHFE